MGRRRFLGVGGAVTTGLLLGGLSRPSSASPVEVAPDLQVIPRSDWGGDLAPRGPLEPEAPGDVRFLLVHHTASGNDYGPGDTVGQLRSFYDLHTNDRGWADVAYNFFVDRHGQVFEGRTGSLHQPLKGDATGGSQGFALLCCFVGDHSVEPPTLGATSSMIRLLAWLADTYEIPTEPGSTTTFTSRGSNLHPAGSEVTTATIAGHRDMSQTACPGDGVYGAVRNQFPTAVTQRRAEVAAPPTTVAPTTTAAPVTTTPSTTVPTSTTGAEAAVAVGGSDSDGTPWLPVAAGAAAVAALTGGAIALRRRTTGA